MADYEMVPLPAAVARFGLENFFDELKLEEYAEGGRALRYYPADATIEGDIDLDHMFWDGKIAGIYAERDLTLTGSVWNWEIDTTAIFLRVGRDLKCRNLIAGCAEIMVARDLKADGIVVATYNHGRMEISRDVHAKYFIVDDHNTIVGRNLVGGGWTDMPDTNVRESTWLREVRPEFTDEFFKENGFMKCGSGNVDLVKALLAGREILR
jgi:cytoskeletal protein CcmA (bactofilin family)